MAEIDPDRFTLRPVEALRKVYAQVMEERQRTVAFLIASLMASTLTEPTLGVGFGRGCEGAIVDGTGREGVAAVNPLAETRAER
jgi:hypothetical protein